MTSADFQSIFEANKDAVYGFAWRMTGSPETAEDIAQDCFLQLLKSPGHYDGARGPVRAWLLGVARNLILKRWRAEGRWTSLDDEAMAVDPPSNDCRVDEKVARYMRRLAQATRRKRSSPLRLARTWRPSSITTASPVIGRARSRLCRC